MRIRYVDCFRFHRPLVLSFIAMALLCLATTPASAQQREQLDIRGWEQGSPYNALYDADKMVRFKAEFVEVHDIPPSKHMAPGIGFILSHLETGDVITAHFAPVGYAPFVRDALRPGDTVTVKGCFVEIDGKEVLLLSKIKVNEVFEFKVRKTSDGVPLWTIPMEEILKQELAD